MTVRIVRLGTRRGKAEGVRIGTVRRPPRGVPRTQLAAKNWYDVWYPALAPSLQAMKLGRAANSDAEWARFAKRYRTEMSKPEARHALALLARLSHHLNYSVGCYCENEARCHRSIQRALLLENGADVESRNADE